MKFKVGRRRVVLEYESEIVEGRWIWEELIKKRRAARLSHVFRFQRDDLIEEPADDAFDDIGGFTYRFRLAASDGDYWRIDGRKLAIENDVLIAKGEIDWARKIFAADRNVSIFLRISKVIGPGREIVSAATRRSATM